MPVLIDGNNLIYATRDLEDPDRPIGRLMLAHLLGDWAAKTGQAVQIVYDGPVPDFAQRQQYEHPSLTVAFSGKGVTADEVIADLVSETSAPRHLTVVSSDREVQGCARRRRAQIANSAEFWKRVKADLARPEPTPLEPDEKSEGLEDQQVDEWMRLFGFDAENDRKRD